ncbi:MAG TPA: hypothetical protein VGF97_02810 [Rhizomicrobium sp.]|jgi:hypothetical protein
MTKTLTRVYGDFAGAKAVVHELEAAGLADGNIGIVASNADGWHKPGGSDVAPEHDKARHGNDDRATGAATGGGLGAVAGGTVGVLTGLGMLAIPGVGPVVAAGWLATAAAGAVAVGAAGGLVGALAGSGTSKENAELYAEAVRRGGTVVTARVPDDEEIRYAAIMDNAAIDVAGRAATYRSSGWTGYNPSAPAYDAEQVRRERTAYL